MADYISRHDALDALGVTKNATKYGGDHSGYDTMMLYEIHDVLTGIPAADVVQVVRCKDCKHYQPSHCKVWSKYGTIQTRENGYCYMAEQREECEI